MRSILPGTLSAFFSFHHRLSEIAIVGYLSTEGTIDLTSVILWYQLRLEVSYITYDLLVKNYLAGSQALYYPSGWQQMVARNACGLGRSFKNIFGISPEKQLPEPVGGISLHSQRFPFMKHGAPGSLGFIDTHYRCQDQAMGTNNFSSCCLDPNS